MLVQTYSKNSTPRVLLFVYQNIVNRSSSKKTTRHVSTLSLPVVATSKMMLCKVPK